MLGTLKSLLDKSVIKNNKRALKALYAYQRIDCYQELIIDLFDQISNLKQILIALSLSKSLLPLNVTR